jgi:hypothetical protein
VKRRISLLVLGALNLLLLAVVGWQAALLRELRPPPRTSHTTTNASGSATGRPPEAEPAARPTPLPPAQATSTNPTLPPPAPDWRQIESADYRAYIRNLRAAGCPEATIRDIVTADVAQTFSARRRAAMAEALAGFQYWATGPASAQSRAALAEQQRAVDAEMGGVLASLLGTEAAIPDVRADWRTAVTGQQLSFLPEDKRAATVAVLARSGDVGVQIPKTAGNQLAADQAVDLQQRLASFDQQREALLAVLTPEEFERVDMSVSCTADNLRRAMTRFQPTEAEFTAIFREWRAHDERIARLWAVGEPDPGNDAVFARIRELLGDERFEEYHRTWWR